MTEIECQFLKRGLEIYKLFLFCEKEPIWGSYRTFHEPLHLHHYYPLCKYLRGLRSINGPTVLDPNLSDLACEFYLNVSVEIVTYPDVWYSDYDIHYMEPCLRIVSGVAILYLILSKR